MTEPQTNESVVPGGLVFPCFSWIPIPLAVAMTWLGFQDDNGFVPSIWVVLGFLVGLAGLVMAIYGLIETAEHPALRDPAAGGHWHALFGVLSNAAALAILLVVLVLALS